MGIRPGNQYWRNVEKPGSKKKYTGDELWEKFISYMETNDRKSWEKQDFIKSGPDAGKIISLEIQNPPSISGFCIHAGICYDTFANYCKKSSGMFEIASAIREIIQTIQIDGATVGIFNQFIVSKVVGLVEKKHIETTETISDDERKEMIADILSKIKKKDVTEEETYEDLI